MESELQDCFKLFRGKMEAAGCPEGAIRCFERSYRVWREGENGVLGEGEIEVVSGLEELEELKKRVTVEMSLFRKLAIVKLNGGLGTSMGLDRPKSLLEVREGKTFLELIVEQYNYLKEKYEGIRFFLLNSYNTSKDTLEYLEKLGVFESAEDVELMQNRVPKVELESGLPASWPRNPELEWCPPGHGDLYTVLGQDSLIDKLLSSGIEYMFVSNSDNLGATPDGVLLTWFAESGAPFLMEVTLRTSADRKGGHLALRGGRYVLRELAQCPPEDLEAFQDIHRHRYFNTNNIWIGLRALKGLLDEHGGFLPLPVIPNRKNLDPRDVNSPEVIQLETAMGAAIELFDEARAVVVPRGRFSPVKTTSDLLALRSDAYEVSGSGEVRLVESRQGRPPRVELDKNYKFYDQLEELVRGGVPSLRECEVLRIRGKVRMARGVEIRGQVEIENCRDEVVELLPGVYENQSVKFGR